MSTLRIYLQLSDCTDLTVASVSCGGKTTKKKKASHGLLAKGYSEMCTLSVVHERKKKKARFIGLHPYQDRGCVQSVLMGARKDDNKR